MLIPFLRSRKNWKDRLPIGNEIGIDRFSKIKADTCSYKKKKEKKKKRGTFFDGGRYHHQAIRISLSRDWYFSAHVVTLKVGWEKEGKREREREKGNGDVPTAASLQHLSSIPFYSHPFNLHDFCAVSPLLPYLILHPFLSLLPFTVRDFFSLRTHAIARSPRNIGRRIKPATDAIPLRHPTRAFPFSRRFQRSAVIHRIVSAQWDLLTKRAKVFQLAFLSSYIIHTKKQ